MPLIWHQTLLVFIQRYKNELTVPQQQQIRALLRKQVHHAITPDIRRELYASKSDPTSLSSRAVSQAASMAASPAFTPATRAAMPPGLGGSFSLSGDMLE